MVSINEFLQNKGYVPNKEMSNERFTAYNIDSYGKITILDTLIVNNHDKTWFDKANKTSGKLVNLVINLGITKDYADAYNYIRSFVVLIPEWRSDVTEAIKPNENALEYKDELLNRIYNLQVFAIMVRNYFDGKYFGYHHLTSFSFQDFIDNEDFNSIYKVAYKIELDNLTNNPEAVNKAKDIYDYGLQGHQLGFPELPQKKTVKRKRRMTSINKELERMEREEEEHEAMIEMEGGEDALAAYKKQKLKDLKEWYEKHKDD